jgi:hypothetical protein
MRTLIIVSAALSLAACFSKPDAPGSDGAVDGAARMPDGQVRDAAADSGPDSTVGDGGVADAGPDAAVLSVTGMLAVACPGGTCNPSKVVSYWKNDWDTYATKRTVRFQDVSTTEQHLVVSDAAGQPATLDFAPGVPVSLTVLNPGDTGSTGKHTLTAPRLFRAVAWRRARTIYGEYRAADFDSFSVRRRSGSDLSVVLDFVPINAGTYDVYCQIGVPNGNAYEAIVSGTVQPDLANTAGHAGKGARAIATIGSALGVSITQPTSSLGGDPRRLATASVWGQAVRDEAYRTDPVRLFEFTDDEFEFVPANVSLSANVGHVVRIANPSTNLKAHVYSASTFYGEAVLREVQDDDVEVETSTLTSIQILPGQWMELFVVPTVPATYGTFCDVGVQFNPDGTPKLTTGHAAKGMVGTVTVTP